MNTGTFVWIVRATMLAGALYDLFFAICILAAPAALAGALGLEMPQQQIYLRFLGVFLAGVPAFYLMPVLHPGRYLGNVVAAALLRALGGVFLVVAVLGYGEPKAFLVLAAADLAFAAVHYLSLVPFAGLAVWKLTGVDLSPRGAATGGS
ncbi:MAG: hypothetical protein HY049_03595 [Acidobacteria bacterium]|nr:hypothetical protein [Acidobacteriota bacterium]